MRKFFFLIFALFLAASAAHPDQSTFEPRKYIFDGLDMFTDSQVKSDTVRQIKEWEDKGVYIRILTIHCLADDRDIDFINKIYSEDAGKNSILITIHKIGAIYWFIIEDLWSDKKVRGDNYFSCLLNKKQVIVMVKKFLFDECKHQSNYQ